MCQKGADYDFSLIAQLNEVCDFSYANKMTIWKFLQNLKSRFGLEVHLHKVQPDNLGMCRPANNDWSPDRCH